MNPIRIRNAEQIVQRAGRMTLDSLRRDMDIICPKEDPRVEVTSRKARRKIKYTDADIKAIVRASEKLVIDFEAQDEVVFAENDTDRDFYQSSRHWDR